MNSYDIIGGIKMKTGFEWLRNWVLYAMLVPAIILVFIFSYIPMYGMIIAFQDYQPIHGFSGSPFVGLKWFQFLAGMPDFWQVMFNTLYLAILKIVFGTLASILFALLLNEISFMPFKRIVQTSAYFPNFLSWVIVAGIFADLLSVEGPFNRLLNALGINSIMFLGDNSWFRFTLVSTEVWKGFGWGAILYLAALTNINNELYEASQIDGANRLQQILNITLPGIMPTIVLLATLNLGNILNAGFEQVLMMYNPVVYKTSDIIDTFVYRAGLMEAQYSLATAVGLGKSVVGVILIALSYKLAYKFSNYRIF